MSKKRLVTLILSIGIFLSLAATVFAAGQPRRYNENSTVKGTISQSFYQVNYRTPHYQSPETIARQHYTDTWVEQILSYPIDGIDVKSLA